MKLIRKGSPDARRIWRGKCETCRSVFECEERELTSIQRSQRDGDFSWETCPECGASLKCSGKGACILFRLASPLRYADDNSP
jgi:hypothetical protein